ncbi:MAG TPA: hypothetical protein VN026_01190 [Bacteroidia bacterium]|nr:hypothetical protein [Bacteroidia bacterium]
MEETNIFFHALAYIAFVILSGIAFLISFIFFVIRVSQGHQHRWNWLAAAIITLLIMLFSVFLFVNKVMHTVKNLGNHVEKKFEESMEDLQKADTSYKYTKLNTNETVKKLKEFEIMNKEATTPKEFYVYYGFNDYYRMPLTYPFSLHSTDVLETAALYNERNVTEFNINDNEEEDCGISGISDFAFDHSVIIAKIKEVQSKKEAYQVYSFTEKKLAVRNSFKEAFQTARKEFNYRGYDTLISVLQYNKLFN